jgi:hypothetical protein
MQTKLHSYWFNVGNATEKAEYDALSARLKADLGRDFFNVISTDKNRASGNGTGTIELDPTFLFSNQWNTTPDSPTHPNARVFDWYEEFEPCGNKKIKSGHWLEITDEMRAIRQTTLVCGYCGKHYPNGQPGFCTACLDSPYLKETELHLLRLLPVALKFPTREPLTDSERTDLLPRYIERQTTGNESRALKAKESTRRRVIEKYTKEKQAVENEYKGFMWLMDHNVNVDNVIFYSHTGKFSFGWRQSLEPSVKSKLLDLLCEFPFEYEFAKQRV